MSSDWKQLRLGDHCTKIGSGSTPTGGKDAYLTSGPFTLIRSQNIYNDGFTPNGLAFIGADQAKKLNGVSVEENDVLLNITGDSVARVCLAPSKYLPARVNQHVAIIRPKLSSFDCRFLRYFLASPQQQEFMLGLASAGATRPALTKVMIEDFEIPCPPLVDQRAIADTLSSLDDRIELLSETNATLEAIAQALFKSWFVDFDPVRAKQQGQLPDGMDEVTAALFPDSFEESELGLVPKGWQTGTILKLARLLSGGTPKTTHAEYWGGTIPWASAKDVSQSRDSLLIQTERNITDLGLAKSSTKIIPAFSTVVVARGATTGRMVLFGDSIAMNQTCYALESKIRAPIALYCQLRRDMGNLVNTAHGSVFDTITTNTFEQFKILLPPTPLLQCFDEATRPLFERILAGIKSKQVLSELRDALLPRLISGQLRLADVESAVEKATA